MTSPELSDREKATKEALEMLLKINDRARIATPGEMTVVTTALLAYNPPPEPIPQIPVWEELTQQQQFEITEIYGRCGIINIYESIRRITSKPA